MLSKTISRIRRNHALEHATIHVLTEKHKRFSAQGNSSPGGFNLNIYGEVTEEDVAIAVEEAYKRMMAGEKELAVHPNCGTVLLTGATMAVLAANATLSWEQRRQRRSRLSLPVLIGSLPTAVVAVTVALIASRPLGMALQASYTVDGELGDLRVTSIRKISPSLITRLFQVLLGQANNEQVHAYRVETVG